MFWRRRKPQWLIDPSKVALGSVIENGRNLSRSHVRVRYRKQPKVCFVPVDTFIQRCLEPMRAGRSLDIEHLLVAPILKRRYMSFFDALTNWDPAIRRSSRPRPGHQLSELRGR